MIPKIGSRDPALTATDESNRLKQLSLHSRDIVAAYKV